MGSLPPWDLFLWELAAVLVLLIDNLCTPVGPRREGIAGHCRGGGEATSTAVVGRQPSYTRPPTDDIHTDSIIKVLHEMKNDGAKVISIITDHGHQAG